MIRGALIIVLVCTLSAIASTNRYALLVGSNDGGSSLDRLRYAEKDAQRFSEVLTSLGRFSPSSLRVLLRPDSAALDRSLHQMDSLMRAGKQNSSGLFIFYFSGHSDQQRLLLGTDEGYALQRIKHFIDSMPIAMKIGIFDACHSGAITTLKGGLRSDPFFLEPFDTVRGQIMIASSSALEKAQESEALKSSIFSHHWFNALRGSADINNDKRVTVNEAYQYAYRKTLETSALTNAGLQRPVYRFNIRGQGDIVLTDLSNRKGGVLLTSETQGKFLISSDDYLSIYADFLKRSGSELFISLRPGRYTAICASGEEVTMHAFTIGENATYRLNRGHLRPLPLHTARTKGADVASSDPIRSTTLTQPNLSWGVGAGIAVVGSQVENLRDRATSVSLSGHYFLDSRNSFFVDLNAFLPGVNGGIEAGYCRFLLDGPARPFIGASAGLHYLSSEERDHPDRWGPSFAVRAGGEIPLTQQVHAQLIAPLSVVFGPDVHYAVGVQVRLLLRAPHHSSKAAH